MLDQKVIELLIRAKADQNPEFVQAMAQLGQQGGDAFSQAMEAAMGRTKGLFTGSQYGPAGQSSGFVSFGGSGGGGGAPPPGPGAPQSGPVQPPRGPSYPMTGNYVDQAMDDLRHSPYYGTNSDLSMMGAQAKAMRAVQRAGVNIDLSDEQRSSFRSASMEAEGTLRELTDKISSLQDELRQNREAYRDNTLRLEQLKASPNADPTEFAKVQGAVRDYLDKEDQYRRATEGAVRQAQAKQEIDMLAGGGGGGIGAGTIISGVGALATTLGIVASLPNMMGRSTAFQAQLERGTGRAAMNGDITSLLADEMMGGYGSVRERAGSEQLTAAMAKILAAGAAGAAGGTFFGGPLGTVLGGAGGAGLAAFREFFNYNSNVQGDIQTKRQNTIFENEEYFKAFQMANPLAREGFLSGRQMGGTGFGDFMASGENFSVGRGFSLSPEETFGINRRLVQGIGGNVNRYARTPYGIDNIYRLMATGILPNAPEILGGSMRGGNRDLGADLSDMVGSAYNLVDHSQMAGIFGQYGSESGVGLGAESAARRRLNASLGTAEGFDGNPFERGVLTQDLQRQASNIDNGPEFVRSYGLLTQLPALQKALGLKSIDPATRAFLIRYGSTMDSKSLAAYFKRRGISTSGNFDAATAMIQNEGAYGLDQLKRGVGGQLGEMMQMQLSGASTAGDYVGGMGLPDALMSGASPSAGATAQGQTALQNTPIAGQYAEFYGKETSLAVMKVVTGLSRLSDALSVLERAIQDMEPFMNKIQNSTRAGASSHFGAGAHY
jgi:hypothetical protein